MDKNGLTALHYAAGRGDLGIVVALLELRSRALPWLVYAWVCCRVVVFKISFSLSIRFSGNLGIWNLTQGPSSDDFRDSSAV